MAVAERAGADPRPLTVIVGAGASMEAELPSWPDLVQALIEGVGEERLTDPASRDEWRSELMAEGLLAAAAVARALTADEGDFVERLRVALYRGRAASSYFPQALAQQMAWLKQQVPSTRIATGNYDGLIEHALRDRGLVPSSYVQWRPERLGTAAVYHLHGRLIPSYPRTGRIVLSEEDYAQVQYAQSWQDRFMRDALENSLCVFVGLSLTDPNLIRWLYRYSDPDDSQLQHIALFVRQGNPGLRREVRSALEDSARARWLRCGVEAVWADFFGESAQFIHEIAMLRSCPGSPKFPDRALERLDEGKLFLAPSDPERFRAVQDRISPLLGRLVNGIREITAAAGVDVSGEELGLGVWGVDHADGTLTCWVTSDRRLNDMSGLVANPLEYDSPWVAIQAVTRGVVVQRDPNVFASRWRLIRGIPIVVEDPDGASRSIVGALTLTSMTPAAQSELSSAPRGLLGAIDAALAEAAAGFFVPAPAPAA